MISKGIKLGYSATGDTYTDLTNLQEIPDLGGNADAIEITTLADAAHMYTDGLYNYGESLDFKFLYEKAQFTTLSGLTTTTKWQVTLPDESTCKFDGTCSVKLDGVGTNAAMTYTLSIKPSTKMVFA